MAIQSNAHLCLLNGLLPVRSAFWPLSPIYNFAFNHIHMYTIPPSVFGHPLSQLPWRLLLNTWLTFLLVSILLIWPIQSSFLVLTNGSTSKSPNSCINSLLHYLLQFSFILIPPFWSHTLGFLTVIFSMVVGCQPIAQPPVWRASPPYS